MRLTRKVSDIIFKAYAKRYNLQGRSMVASRRGGPPVDASHYQVSRLRPVLAFLRQNRVKVTLLASITLVVALGVYYFNLLTDTEQNMYASYGNVEALLQRRNDIAKSLSKAVLDYSRHEEQVFASVVSLRSFMSVDEATRNEQLQKLSEMLAKQDKSVSPSGSPANPLSSLANLFAVAEQYPDLKLATNFQSLMAALVEVEKDLAGHRITLNNDINIYTTNVAKFPCKIYARLFGFGTKPYFEASSEAKNFTQIDY